jgi:hypothetical protein
MTTITPQVFPKGALTLLPEKDFPSQLNSLLPMIYQQMPNFMGVAKAIAKQKQQYYDIIRSLVNSINYNGVNDDSTASDSSGDYLRIAASAFASTYSNSSDDSGIKQLINNRITFVTSRGTIRDFYQYYLKNNLQTSFTPALIKESGNATITVTTSMTPTDSSFQKLSYDLFKIKAAGIRIMINSTATKQFFELAKPDGTVASDGLGFSYLDPRNNPIGGGNFKTLTT